MSGIAARRSPGIDLAIRGGRQKNAGVRRRISITCLVLAWLCADGAVWNVVQVVAWARMFHGYTQVMPAAQALQRTFDGAEPCALCQLAERGHRAERDQQPANTVPGAAEKILLACDEPATVVFLSPDLNWPGVVDAAGLTRTESVPVPPPRV